MFFNKLVVAAFPFFFAIGSQATQNATLSQNTIPVDAVGNIVAAQLSTGDTRIFFEPPSGGIGEICVTGSFSTGDTYCDGIFTPPEVVLHGTPIAVVNSLAIPNQYTEVRVFFFSKDYILSEWIWTSDIGTRGGDACPECITHNGFAVVPGSQALYAMINPSAPASKVRVGFISPGSPDTITEAILNGNTNKWSLSVLPN